MTNIYKRVEPKEGEYIQFVGVHVLDWDWNWGRPTDGFIEVDSNEADELRALLKEVMGWIDNWDPNFIDDDEWPETKAKIKAAVNKARGD